MSNSGLVVTWPQPSLEPESSEEIGGRKVDNVQSVKPDFLASANPGCTLQILKILHRCGITLSAARSVEILDASIRGGGLNRESGSSRIGLR